MQLENQLSTLQQSRKLYEFGIRHEKPEVCWVSFKTGKSIEHVLCRLPTDEEESAEPGIEWLIVGQISPGIAALIKEGCCYPEETNVYPAYSLTELLFAGGQSMHVAKGKGTGFVAYNSRNTLFHAKQDVWPAWAVAQCIIAEIKDGGMVVSEVNENLKGSF